MRRKKLFFLFLFILTNLTAQEKITLEQIWSGYFRTQQINELKVMKNTCEYTVLNHDRTTGVFTIDLYDFATLKKKSALFSSQNFPEIHNYNIEGYSFDQSEKKILIATNSESIFRRSFTADFFVYDLSSKKLQKVGNKLFAQEPTFVPNQEKIVYAFENNLYLFDLNSNTETQITTDGYPNQIINGITDWVYEEEFAFVRAFEISKNGNYLAYIRFDETEVPEFSMDIYNDKNHWNYQYPSQQVFKYPKAGQKNSTVSLHIYDFKTQTTKEIQLGVKEEFYIPRIKWTNDDNLLSVQTLNRHQNNLNLCFVDVKSEAIKIIHNEKDTRYVDISNNLTFLDDNSFIWTSEKDGFNHIYHYEKNGTLIRQITKGSWEVTEFYGYDPKTKTIFYQSTEDGSTNRTIYKIGLNGKNKTRISNQNGTSNATFSSDYKYFINSFSSLTEPPIYTLNDVRRAKEIKTIVENYDLKNKLKKFDLPEKKIFEITTKNGYKLNACIVRPKNLDAAKKYPVLIHQYSGPGSQQVKNSWNKNDDYFHYMLTQEGYVIVTVDTRGTGYKGVDFKKCTYKELGKYETEDLIEVAKIVGNYPYIDASRIGIWGWSYGGFMASNCILKGNDVFSLAIAVAPVTNWMLYDTIYTERFMQTPQENPDGYNNNSPLFFADRLKGNFLIIHGSADDNVHVQNSMLMIEALIHKNKQFDWAIYPDKNHGIYGGTTRLQLYTKIKNFIQERL